MFYSQKVLNRWYLLDYVIRPEPRVHVLSMLAKFVWFSHHKLNFHITLCTVVIITIKHTVILVLVHWRVWITNDDYTSTNLWLLLEKHLREHSVLTAGLTIVLICEVQNVYIFTVTTSSPHFCPLVHFSPYCQHYLWPTIPTTLTLLLPLFRNLRYPLHQNQTRSSLVV